MNHIHSWIREANFYWLYRLQWTMELIREERSCIDRITNLIHTSGSPDRGVIREIDFAGTTLTAPVLYNPERALDERNHWYSYVTWLKELIESGKDTVVYRKEKELYRKMTMEKMFITLAKLKKVTVNGQDIIRPLTKEQRDIFIAFSITRPCVG